MARSYLARTTGWYRLRAAEEREPDVALLTAVEREGLANRALNAQR